MLTLTTHTPVHRRPEATHSSLFFFSFLTFHSLIVVPLMFTVCFHFLNTSSTTSEPLQALPLCLKQEMSPEVTSTSPSPNMAASNLAFAELQALQKSVSVSSNSCGNSNHFPNTFNSFSHHAPVYGQFSSQPIMSGNAGIHLIHVHTRIYAVQLLI